MPTRLVVYEGPSDVMDVRNIVGHALKFYPADGNPDVRPRNVKGGEPVEVPEEHVEALLTYPNHRFRLVEEEPQQTRGRAARETQTESAHGPESEVVPVVDSKTGESVKSKKGGS